MIVITKFLLIIMSAAVLLLGGQQIIGNNILERGPVAVLADEDDCANDPNQLDCNNPGSWEGTIFPDEPTPPAPVYNAPSQTSGDFTYRYPECDWNSNQVYEVWQDSSGNYDRRNYQTQPGQCGAQSQTAPASGDFTYRYPECDWDNHQVREVWQDSSGNYQYRNVHTEPGQCNAPARVSQAPAPATNQNTNNNSNTNQNTTNVTNNIVNQNQNTSNSSSSSSSTANVTVNQEPAQGGFAVRFATIDCPSGTTKKVSGNEIICEIVQPVTVKVAGVTQTETKELPKTGLPLLAWAAGAFIPAGWGLKRFGKGISFDMEDNANFLWEERQFKAGS